MRTFVAFAFALLLLIIVSSGSLKGTDKHTYILMSWWICYFAESVTSDSDKTFKYFIAGFSGTELRYQDWIINYVITIYHILVLINLIYLITGKTPLLVIYSSLLSFPLHSQLRISERYRQTQIYFIPYLRPVTHLAWLMSISLVYWGTRTFGYDDVIMTSHYDIRACDNK